MSKVEKLGRIYGGGENPTVQSTKEECDINVIVARAKAGADVSHLVRQGTYGDFTQFPDLRDAMLQVVKAKEMFMSLDPYIRKRFNNDPAALVEFCEDPSNRDEAIKLGFIEAPKAPAVPEEPKEPVAPPTKK